MNGLDYLPLIEPGDRASYLNPAKAIIGMGLLLVGAAGWAVSQGTRFFKLDNGSLPTFAAHHLAQRHRTTGSLPTLTADHLFERHNVLKASQLSQEEVPAPFWPLQGIDEVMIHPGPVNLLQAVSALQAEPSCVFVYGPLGKALLASGNVTNGRANAKNKYVRTDHGPSVSVRPIEGWVYGAHFNGKMGAFTHLASPSGNEGDVVKGWLLFWSAASPKSKDKLAVADHFHGYDPSEPSDVVNRSVVWVTRRDGTSERAFWYFTEKLPPVKEVPPVASGSEFYQCAECDLVVPDSGSLTRHIRTHTSYLCALCEKTFLEASLLDRHLKTHTTERPYQCFECGLIFSKAGALQAHVRTHFGDEPYACTVCNKSFGRAFLLEHHMRTHTGAKPYQCGQCGKTFSQVSNLQVHIRTHTGEKPFSCSFCNKSFTQAASLQNHQRIHTGEKPYSCPICGRKFSISSNVKEHMRVHTGEKPFSCPECNNTFSTSRNQKEHMRIHSGEKPFNCSHCGMKFAIQKTLQTHLRSHRKFEENQRSAQTVKNRAHPCPHCEKSFSRLQDLTVHGKREHAGRKLYLCPYCNQSFYMSIDLRRHLRGWHPLEQKPSY
eukprot:gb/GEZN01004650.1/.p1 GENE.gb/GEZN01004650.1/~~gb/GEZN01004650.1/.p1  ORF type:complete len:603 (-),score=42.05 gb/GEZN01004650.1/:14-1822(-)